MRGAWNRTRVALLCDPICSASYLAFQPLGRRDTPDPAKLLVDSSPLGPLGADFGGDAELRDQLVGVGDFRLHAGEEAGDLLGGPALELMREPFELHGQLLDSRPFQGGRRHRQHFIRYALLCRHVYSPSSRTYGPKLAPFRHNTPAL
jgi:hypothetical protein